MSRRVPLLLGVALATAYAGSPASAQALLELTDAPRPGFPATWETTNLTAHADVTGQAATVRLSQTFQNVGSRPLEARLLFPLPAGAAVRALTLLVDGRELVGTLQPADEARNTYEAIVRKNRDPALLEYAGRGLYRTSVFPIPAGAERTVQIRYTQLLTAEDGLVDLTIPVGAAGNAPRPVRAVEVSASIKTDAPLKVVYSPTHEMNIDRPDDNRASAELQLTDVSGRRDVRLLFGTADGLVGLNVLAHREGASPNGDGEPADGEAGKGEAGDPDGFFLLLAAPDVPDPGEVPPPRTLAVVIDTSGSMQGEKMAQAKAAAAFVASRLRAEDTFNVVAYSDVVTPFAAELRAGDDAGRKAAAAFIDNLRAGGGTNIHDALTTTLGMLPARGDRPTYLLFLTDGEPTEGVTDETQIAAAVAAANGGEDASKARVFTFGVGEGVNARLLDRLSGGGRGVSTYVAPTEDVERAVSDLYAKIAAPVLTGLSLTFAADDGTERQVTNRVLPADLPDLFSGQQLQIVGRYAVKGDEPVAGTFTLAGTSTAGDGEGLSFSVPVTLPADGGGDAAFLPALWATRRIGELIDRLDLRGENPELVEELVRLSTRYGILTPYTAFLAEEDVRLGDVAGNAAAAGGNLRTGLGRVSGGFGVGQRAFKGGLKGAGRGTDNSGYADEFESGGAGFGGGLGGGGFGGGGIAPGLADPAARPAAAAPPQRLMSELFAGEPADAGRSRTDSVKQLAGRTLFFKNGRWEESGLTEEQAKDPTRVEQFSDAYFALVKTAGDELAPLLTLAEPALVRIDGTTYLVVPPAESDAEE